VTDKPLENQDAEQAPASGAATGKTPETASDPQATKSAYGRRRNKAAQPANPQQATAQPTQETDEAAVDEPADALAQAQAQAAEYLDLAQRARAEFENYRRRTKAAEAEAELKGKGAAVLQLLPVLDNLQRALEARPNSEDEDDAFVQGVAMVTRQFEDILASLEVTAVAGLNEVFDPAVHYAVGNEVRPDVAPGTITQTLQTGYKLKEYLLRPAMVLVQGEA